MLKGSSFLDCEYEVLPAVIHLPHECSVVKLSSVSLFPERFVKFIPDLMREIIISFDTTDRAP